MQVTENANTMGMQRVKMIKMPVDTFLSIEHLRGQSFIMCDSTFPSPRKGL